MAGLITSVDGLASSGLVSFLTGDGIATKTGRVEQFRNRLNFEFGNIVNGVTEDGKIFDIRVNGLGDFEYGENLSYARRSPDGVIDSGDALTINATQVRRRLEQGDIARVAYSLLLASKGQITEEDLNTNPAYSTQFVIDRKDAFDRLNIDIEKSFEVNGAEFEVQGDEIRIRSLPGQSRTARDREDPDIARARKRIEDQAEALGIVEGVQEIEMEDATIGELLSIREQLEAQYTYVTFNFDKSAWIASNDFKDVFETVTEIPDAFLMGANLAYQLETSLGDDLTSAEKNEIFPASINYFSSLVVGAITGLPTQVRSEYEFHAGTNLFNLYGFDEDRAIGKLEQIRPKLDAIVENLFDAVAQVQRGADLEELRDGLDAELSGSSYTLRRYSPAI